MSNRPPRLRAVGDEFLHATFVEDVVIDVENDGDLRFAPDGRDGASSFGGVVPDSSPRCAAS